MKIDEVTGASLDWAVAKCEGLTDIVNNRPYFKAYSPSTNWAQGGPIIEHEGICLTNWAQDSTLWGAAILIKNKDNTVLSMTGLTPLIAAMRCYVASKLGNEVPHV